MTMFWGANMGVYRIAMNGDFQFDPILMVFFRFAPAVPLFFLLLYVKEKSIGISWRAIGTLSIASLLGVTGLEFAVIYSAKWTTLANATLLNVAPWPIFTAIFAAIYMKDRVTSNLIYGGIAALTGVSLLIVGGKEGLDFSSGNNLAMWGNLVAFLSSIAGALFNVLCMPLMKQYSPLRITAWSIGLGSLFMVPFTLTRWNDVAWSQMPLEVYGAIVYNVLFCSFIAFIVWNAAMLKVGATRSNFFRYGVPATAILVGFLFFDESFTLVQLLGALFMAGGLVWITLDKKIA